MEKWQQEIIDRINSWGVEDNPALPPMDPLGAYAEDDPETHARLRDPIPEAGQKAKKARKNSKKSKKA